MDCRKIEAILFLSAKGWTVKELSKMLKEKEKDVEECLKMLKERYKSHPTLEIKKIENKWEMNIKDEVSIMIRKFYNKAYLSQKEVELLAYIHKNPNIMKSKLAKTLGSWVYSTIKSLKEKGFIEEKKQGRTSTLKTTEKFTSYFKL